MPSAVGLELQKATAVDAASETAIDVTITNGWDASLHVTVRRAAPHELRKASAVEDLEDAIEGMEVAVVVVAANRHRYRTTG